MERPRAGAIGWAANEGVFKLNLAVVVSFHHALSVASLPRLRFVRLVGLPASRVSRATVSASSTLDSMSRLSAPCARVSFEASKYCEVPAMRPVTKAVMH